MLYDNHNLFQKRDIPSSKTELKLHRAEELFQELLETKREKLYIDFDIDTPYNMPSFKTDLHLNSPKLQTHTRASSVISRLKIKKYKKNN